jgi:hypothetical protein
MSTSPSCVVNISSYTCLLCGWQQSRACVWPPVLQALLQQPDNMRALPPLTPPRRPALVCQVMQGRPTGVVAACKDINLGREIQELFASPNMRVNTTTDVTGEAARCAGVGTRTSLCATLLVFNVCHHPARWLTGCASTTLSLLPMLASVGSGSHTCRYYAVCG